MTAGVKGFAFVLGVGTMVSLFTAVPRDPGDPASPCAAPSCSRSTSALGAGREAKKPITFDFMGASKWFFSMSGAILLALHAGDRRSDGLNFGIDFESRHPHHRCARGSRRRSGRSGTRSRPPGFGDAEIQTVKNPEIGETSSRSPSRVEAGGSTVEKRARPNFGRPDPVSVDRADVRRVRGQLGVSAIIASLIVISIYISLRFEWKFAVPVLIALMHDILITAGVYALSAGR